MPNYCSYDMKVKAKNKENLLEFIKIIQSDYDYNNNKFTAARHLWRVFEADCEEDEIEESEDCFSIIIYGDCAWSVNCCMLEGAHTYYNDHLNDPRNSSLLRESKILDLEIEVFGEELGAGFQEHYIIKNGEITLEETSDAQEFCYEDCKENEKEALEEINKYTNGNLKTLEEFFNGEDYVTVSNFSEYGTFII